MVRSIRPFFNNFLKDEFQALFPDYDIQKYFVSGTYAFGRSKSLGTITPVDTGEDHILHSNWATNPCERFHVGEMRIVDFLRFLGKF